MGQESQDELPRIFEKGFTGTNGRETERSTGMGLYLCHKLCRKLGIDIRAVSEEGTGTEMILECPVVMALLISGLVTVYAGNRFNFYTGVHTPSAAYFLMGAALFFGIYAAYFAVTYIGFKRNVERE